MTPAILTSNGHCWPGTTDQASLIKLINKMTGGGEGKRGGGKRGQGNLLVRDTYPRAHLKRAWFLVRKSHPIFLENDTLFVTRSVLFYSIHHVNRTLIKKVFEARFWDYCTISGPVSLLINYFLIRPGEATYIGTYIGTYISTHVRT